MTASLPLVFIGLVLTGKSRSYLVPCLFDHHKNNELMEMAERLMAAGKARKLTWPSWMNGSGAVLRAAQSAMNGYLGYDK